VAVTLRLARYGQRNRPVYRIVAANNSSRRDGRFLEILGNYNPLTNPPTANIKEEKIKKWIDLGASTSRIVGNIIKKRIPGLVEGKIEAQKSKIVAQRRKRKERAAARA
jgi:small subunit ribosomal protein S16